MTSPEPDPVEPTRAEQREAALDRLVMDYPVDLEWPTGEPDEATPDR